MSKNSIKQFQTAFSLKKTVHQLLLNFKLSMIRLHGFRLVEMGQVKNPRWLLLLKIAKNNNNKINFFSRTTEYFWLNFGMKYQRNIGIQNCKNEKKIA